MQYKITFQRFLKGYGASTDNKELIELAKFGFAKVEGKKLESEDILSEEEVEKIIACCIGIRDSYPYLPLQESIEGLKCVQLLLFAWT